MGSWYDVVSHPGATSYDEAPGASGSGKSEDAADSKQQKNNDLRASVLSSSKTRLAIVIVHDLGVLACMECSHSWRGGVLNPPKWRAGAPSLLLPETVANSGVLQSIVRDWEFHLVYSNML